MFHVERVTCGFCVPLPLFHVEHKEAIQMFHVEQRNNLLTIFNKEIFKNIWNVTKKFVSLQC